MPGIVQGTLDGYQQVESLATHYPANFAPFEPLQHTFFEYLRCSISRKETALSQETRKSDRLRQFFSFWQSDNVGEGGGVIPLLWVTRSQPQHLSYLELELGLLWGVFLHKNRSYIIGVHRPGCSILNEVLPKGMRIVFMCGRASVFSCRRRGYIVANLVHLVCSIPPACYAAGGVPFAGG